VDPEPEERIEFNHSEYGNLQPFAWLSSGTPFLSLPTCLSPSKADRPSALPPTAPILTYILTPLHPLLTPLIHLSTTFLLSHLATSYAQLVKDRMFLSAEVMKEYDQRFVYKKVFASRVDRGVMTNQGEW
jgi:hypothetical protein